MKTFFQFSIVLLSFFLGGIAFAETGNLLFAGAASFTTSWTLQFLTGVGIESFSSFSIVLAHIRTTAAGTANPGGGRKLWIIAKDQFAADWGQTAVAGEITAAPTLVEDGGFVELEVADNSLKLDQALKGSTGYQAFETSFEVKIAGDYKEQTVAVEKLINTEVVAVIQLNDLQRKTIGSTIFPLSFEITHSTGAKGSDQRGWTLKAKNDGLPKPSYFLASNVALPILD